MRIALWNTLPAEFFAAGLRHAPAGRWTVRQETPEACVGRLLDGDADVALVPSLVVFSHPAVFDVLPVAAFSSWKYPFARIVLRKGLGEVASVAVGGGDPQAALLARIVLKEHYGLDPAFAPHDGATPDALLAGGHDAALVTGPAVPTLTTPHATLDLGQEWFELVNYPMVWGLFCARRDEAQPPMVDGLREAVKAIEARRDVFMQAREMPPALHAFFADDLRVRFDDLATASLTEFRQFLYYYHVTDEIPELPLFAEPEDFSDDDDDAPLL